MTTARLRVLWTLLYAGLYAGALHAAGDDLPRKRALDDRSYAATPERLARGQYLAEHLLQCFVCHSERDWDRPGAPPKDGRKGAGAVLSERGERRIVAPNITPDVATGAGGWSDDMLARAIREGIGHDERPLYWGMWYESFAALSDEDLAAVIVYLRSIPPVRNALPPTRLPPAELQENAAIPRPITAPVPGPPPDDRLARGRYLVSVADCTGCHTSWDSSRNPGLLAGGNLIVRGTRSAFSTNITRHESGVGYPVDTFIAVLRSGKGGGLSPIMPWAFFRGLSDEDLAAIYDALGVVQPVAHYVGNAGEPSHCAVCGQSHPFGDHNRLETPAGVRLEPAQLERLAGRYYSRAYDFTIEVRCDGRRLFGRVDEEPEIELIAQSATRFLAPGWVAPVEFVLDADGRATQLASLEIDRLLLERMP
jgi:mono/diheme cytochrome c family protein